jgi:DNA repair exonuclease SbcCD nuclease subunit
MLFAGADFHVGRSLRQRHPELEFDSFSALAEVGKLISDKGKVSLILAGDILDTVKLDGINLYSLTRFMAKQDLTVYYIQGNHDKQPDSRDYPLLASFPNAVRLTGTPIDIEGLKVCGLDYMPVEDLLEEVKNIPPCDILVLHTAFAHLVPTYFINAISVGDIPNQISNIIVGDIHTRILVPIPRGDKLGYCLSPGCLHPCEINDKPPFAIWRYNTETTKVVDKWIPVPISTRQIVKVDFDKNTNMTDKMIETLAKQFIAANTDSRKPILHITFYPTHQNYVSQFKKWIADSFIVLETMRVNNADIIEIKDNSALNEPISLVEALNKVLDSTKYPVEHALLTDLLTADDTKKVLVDFIAGHLE